MTTTILPIHPLSTHGEIRAVEQLQREVWGLPDVEVVPLHVLLTAAKNGGLLLGAFDGATLAGFVFGFPGLTPDGKLKHCSHMAGVHPAYRNRGLGYSLKLAQRQHVLAQGIDLITWTFDPLETRNASLNFHKLGAVCNTYIPNLYGEMRDGLNAGLPSDRFQVDWWIASERVAQRLEQPPSGSPSASAFAVTIRWLTFPHSLLALANRQAKLVDRDPNRFPIDQSRRYRAGPRLASAQPQSVRIGLRFRLLCHRFFR